MLQVFIINSFSGDERKTIGIREELEKMRDTEYLVFNSGYSGHEGELARQMCELFPKDQIRFYACGGSGTFRNILKGIPKKDMGRIEMAEVACGLTNDFLNVYGSEREKFTDIRNLIRGRTEELDYLNTSVGPAHNTVSVGFDGIILKGVIYLTKMPFFHGKFPYFLVSVIAALSTKVSELEVTADGEVFRGKFYEAALGNGNLLGGNFHFGDQAQPQDGKMRMILAPKKNLFYKLRIVIAALGNNQEVMEKKMICREVEKVKIRSMDGKVLSINVDGELEMAEELTVEVCRGGLRFVEPVNLNRRKIVWKKETLLHKN